MTDIKAQELRMYTLEQHLVRVPKIDAVQVMHSWLDGMRLALAMANLRPKREQELLDFYYREADHYLQQRLKQHIAELDF